MKRSDSTTLSESAIITVSGLPRIVTTDETTFDVTNWFNRLFERNATWLLDNCLFLANLVFCYNYSFMRGYLVMTSLAHEPNALLD